MSNVDENIERLIVRRLDGELTEDERVELDRALLRSPEARALLEEYERIDASASAALASSLAADGEPSVSFPRIAAPPARKGYSRAWWALPAAVAAAIAVLVTFIGPRPKGPELVTEFSGNGSEQVTPPPQIPVAPEGLAPVRQAGYGSDVDRSTDRDLLYILGTDGNVYVIEQEWVRTARTPRSGVRQASGDL
jgi:anti-sigma factor RsiW